MGTPDETFAVRWDADEVTNLRAALVSGIAAGDLAMRSWWPRRAGWHWYIHGSLEEGLLVTDLVTDVLATRDRSSVRRGPGRHRPGRRHHLLGPGRDRRGRRPCSAGH